MCAVHHFYFFSAFDRFVAFRPTVHKDLQVGSLVFPPTAEINLRQSRG